MTSPLEGVSTFTEGLDAVVPAVAVRAERLVRDRAWTTAAGRGRPAPRAGQAARTGLSRSMLRIAVGVGFECPLQRHQPRRKSIRAVRGLHALRIGFQAAEDQAKCTSVCGRARSAVAERATKMGICPSATMRGAVRGSTAAGASSSAPCLQRL